MRRDSMERLFLRRDRFEARQNGALVRTTVALASACVLTFTMVALASACVVAHSRFVVAGCSPAASI
jgi:hypothetical protein